MNEIPRRGGVVGAWAETLYCSDCQGIYFLIMVGGGLPQPKVKCAGCGACWFLGGIEDARTPALKEKR